MRRMMKTIFAAILLHFCIQPVFAQSTPKHPNSFYQKRDLEQCDRRCTDVYGAPTEGYRERFKLNEKCQCYRNGDFLGVINRLNPPYNIPSAKGVVCGADGEEYPDKFTAAMNGTRALHAGNCGKCSNDHDIGIYKKTKNTLTEISTHCAMKLVIFGLDVGDKCMKKHAGLTPACTTCWTNNMACTFANCGTVCMKSKLKHEPNNINGQLNECLACDEKYCGGMFIKCAGATRRRAGIISDIGRPGDQVWEDNDGENVLPLPVPNTH